MPVHPSASLPWQTYRDARLRALRADPGAFGSTFEREVAFTDETWQQRASGQAFLWVGDEEARFVEACREDMARVESGVDGDAGAQSPPEGSTPSSGITPPSDIPRHAAPRADGLIGLTAPDLYLDDVDAAAEAGELPCPPSELAFITQMWVEPGRRGQGASEELMQAAVGAARAQGLTTLMLHVMKDNQRAIGLYERLGFALREKPISECPDNECEYVLTL